MIVAIIFCAILFAILAWTGCPIYFNIAICVFAFSSGLSGFKWTPTKSQKRINEEIENDLDIYEDFGY